jgi:hypothetical protein
MRIQIALHNRLVAEVIVEQHMVGTFNPHNVYACYAMAKYFAGKECGGAITQRADLPRVWDVPVGAVIE